jgi:hypothetical protein
MFYVYLLPLIFASAYSVPEQRQYNGLVLPEYVTTLNNNLNYKEPRKPYEYSYSVKDEYYGTDFQAAESSDGKSVNGHYEVLLPDGRRQKVEYNADDYTGYNADVSYDGTAASYHISRFYNSPNQPVKSNLKIVPSYPKHITPYLEKPRKQEYKQNSVTTTTKPEKTEPQPILEAKEKKAVPAKESKPKYGYKILGGAGSFRTANYPTLYNSNI